MQASKRSLSLSDSWIVSGKVPVVSSELRSLVALEGGVYSTGNTVVLGVSLGMKETVLFQLFVRYLVDPTSDVCFVQRLSHASVSSANYCETANGSLNQL